MKEKRVKNMALREEEIKRVGEAQDNPEKRDEIIDQFIEDIIDRNEEGLRRLSKA